MAMAMAMAMGRFVFFFLLSSLTLALSQTTTNTTSLGCNGVQLTYSLTKLEKIRPFLPSSPKSQPFAFAATATILNNGLVDLLAWSYLIEFSHRELLVSVNPGVLTSSSPFPFNTSDLPPGSPVSFSGFPNPDLKTPIATANDLAQIQTQMLLTGTLFGASNASAALPARLSLDDPAFLCADSNTSSTTISTCCLPNPNPPPPNATANANASSSSGFLPRRSGDLLISYDVLQAYGSSYLAQVTLANGSPLARLDNWKLSWQWMREEFIYSLRGAYAALNDPAQCILGAQGQYYQAMDFSKVVTCDPKPTVLDLPLDRTNDTKLGMIPSCCRNGTILPAEMDPSQTKSAFQMEVFKMPPDLNRTKLHPPQNWAVTGGALNPTYRCGQPVRVAPTLFPDPSGLQSSTSAIASWQVVCNITRPRGASPKCCVSFSAFYNGSVLPCNTCACGCPPAARRRGTCNATAPALLAPPQALLVPFDNRTDLIREHARLNHLDVPDPMPCGDNCGVSINWHVNGDFRQGWTARMTLFNWQDVSFADWFAAVEMGKAYDGYEAMYSFNGTKMGDGKTIFMQGLPGLNYLVGEVDGGNPSRDPRVPGKQQSVISFTKKTTPGIDVVAGDGFPTKVYFNGEECSMPDRILVSRGLRNAAGGVVGLVLTALVTAAVVLVGL